MPRGGSKDGNNSPLIGDNGVLASTDELTALTRNMRENFIKDLSRPPVDLHDPEATKEAIYNYLLDCEQHGKRPGNMGLYRALDISRQDVHSIITGRDKKKVSPECCDILKKALQMLGEYREQLGAQGKLNPVTMIFWQKNYDGLQDAQQIEVTAQQGPAASMTPEEIARQIEKDIPIDADYQETDGGTQ